MTGTTWHHMEPFGTMVLMTGDRRPRIPAQLAARIDAVRGDVPFERFVRSMLEAWFIDREGAATDDGEDA